MNKGKAIALIICIFTLLTGCSNNKPSQENTSLENSTRIVNSVVGDWYECDDRGDVSARL